MASPLALPARLFACLPVCLFACLPACLFAFPPPGCHHPLGPTRPPVLPSPHTTGGDHPCPAEDLAPAQALHKATSTPSGTDVTRRASLPSCASPSSASSCCATSPAASAPVPAAPSSASSRNNQTFAHPSNLRPPLTAAILHNNRTAPKPSLLASSLRVPRLPGPKVPPPKEAPMVDLPIATRSLPQAPPCILDALLRPVLSSSTPLRG